MALAAAQLRRRVAQGISFRNLLLGGVIAVTAYLVLVPLVFLLWKSLQTGVTPLQVTPLSLKNYATAYLDPSTYRFLANTLWFAVGSVAIGLTLGVGFAWLLERTNVPLKSLLYAVVPLPMIIPGILSAIAWILLLSPRIGVINLSLMNLFALKEAPFNIYTITGMFFLEGVRLVPTIFLMTVGAFRSMDPALDEAGAASGAGTLATLRRITLPMMLPAVLSAAIYTFVTAVEAFEIPGIIGLSAGIPVFSTKIYLATRTTPISYGLASAFAATFVVISVVLMIFYTRMTMRAEKFTTITGKGYRPRVIDIGKWKYPAFALIAAYVLVILVLPFFILVWGSLFPYYEVPSLERLSQVSLTAYHSAFSYPQVFLAFKNTLIVMLVAASFTVILGSLIAWIVVRTPLKGKRLLDMLTFIPHSIPSIVIGLCLVLVYLQLSFIPIYNTLWILVVAFATRYMTFSSRTMNGAMHQIHKELEEAAEVGGASWGQTFIRITIPLLIPSLIGAWLWVAMRSMVELSAAIMLSGPQTTVVSMVVWNLWADGLIPETCVIGVTIMMLMAAILILGRVFGFRLGRGGL